MDLQPRAVELWLKSLPLSAKSMVHYSWRDLPTVGVRDVGRNRIHTAKSDGTRDIKGATKRWRKPHSLTVEECGRFLEQLKEPIRTIALVGVSFGLRISEALALKWSDVDWLNGTLLIERGIVRQRVGNVKTSEIRTEGVCGLGDSGSHELMEADNSVCRR